jgi:translocation protein SEC63
MQLPHFGKKQLKEHDNLAEFLALEDKDVKLAGLTKEQKADVLKCKSLIPQVSVETKIFVDDDEDNKVYEGDLCTVQVKINRENLAEGEKAGLVYAPHFPFPKQEAWWIILGTQEGKIIDIKKIANADKEFTHDIKFLAPRVGTYNFDLHVLSNAYMGIDQKMAVELVTMDAAALPEFKVHPDDAELDDEPTLFEEMLNAHNVEEDSDSEEDDSDSDDEEEEEKGIKELSAAERKKAELQKKRQAAAGDDSDDDSSVEEVYAD